MTEVATGLRLNRTALSLWAPLLQPLVNGPGYRFPMRFVMMGPQRALG